MNKRAQVNIATLWISGSRSTGTGVSDEENVVRAGLGGMAEYWQIQLSEPMPVSSFIHLLATHFFEPTLTEGGQLYKLDLSSTIEFLNVAKEAALIRIDGKEPMVCPRQVVKALLRMPKREHLVPHTLREFLNCETEIDVESDGRSSNDLSPQEPTQPVQAAVPLVHLPYEVLEDFMRDEKKRLGRVPSQNDMESSAREKFGSKYKINQSICRKIHKKVFGAQLPGKRRRNCVE